MYNLEVYTTNFDEINKIGFQNVPNLISFDILMKGIIKNTVSNLAIRPVDKRYSKVICGVKNYLRFKIERSKNSYSLMILVEKTNLEFIKIQ